MPWWKCDTRFSDSKEGRPWVAPAIISRAADCLERWEYHYDDDDDDDDGYPANSPHDKIPPWWEYVINRLVLTNFVTKLPT